MKFVKPFACLIIACLVMTACKKNVIKPLPITEATSSQAQIKIVYSSAYLINYSVQLKVNDVRVSNNITYSTPFPGGGLNTGGGSYSEYMLTSPGDLKIAVSVPNKNANSDSIPLSSNTVNVSAGKNYSVYIADTLASTQAIVVEDNLALVEGDFSRYKFVNVMPNSTGLDLYFGDQLVASNIPYKGVSPEFTLARGAVGTWAIRTAGADPVSTAMAIYPAASSGKQTVPNARVMSVYARGYSGSSGTRAPAISMLYNY
jgi:hypothetical protein